MKFQEENIFYKFPPLALESRNNYLDINYYLGKINYHKYLFYPFVVKDAQVPTVLGPNDYIQNDVLWPLESF